MTNKQSIPTIASVLQFPRQRGTAGVQATLTYAPPQQAARPMLPPQDVGQRIACKVYRLHVGKGGAA